MYVCTFQPGDFTVWGSKGIFFFFFFKQSSLSPGLVYGQCFVTLFRHSKMSLIVAHRNAESLRWPKRSSARYTRSFPPLTSPPPHTPHLPGSRSPTGPPRGQLLNWALLQLTRLRNAADVRTNSAIKVNQQ